MNDTTDNWNDSENTGLVVPRNSLIIAQRTETEKRGASRNGITHNRIQDMLKEKTEALSTAKGILDIHPDLRLVDEVLVAQTLSPKDLSDLVLQLSVDSAIYRDEVDKGLVEELTSLLNTEYNMEENIPGWLSDALVKDGATVHLIVPPANLDKLIQESQGFSMEDYNSMDKDSFFADHGLFKLDDSTKALGLESVSDNLMELMRPDLRKLAKKNETLKQLDLEDFDFGNLDADSANSSDGKTVSTYRFEEVVEDSRDGAMALLKRIPADAIMPLHEPGDESNHVGYFILVDKHGYIVGNSKDANYMTELLTRLKRAMHDEKSAEYEVVKSMNIFTGTEDQKDKNIDKFMHDYIETIEAPIRKMIEESELVDGEIELTNYKSVYHIMLARALKKQKTRMIYVPAEFVSYNAFEYDTSGIGIGLLEKTAYFSSVRAVLQIANMMNTINNSIPNTELAVTLDEDDKDQIGTIETLVHELAKMTSLSFPIGSVNPSEIITSIQKAGYRLKIDGGDRFPRTSVEVNDTQRQKATIDNNLEDDLKRKQYAGMGVTPEAIDQTLQGEFATTAILNDLLAAKRAMNRQRIFSKNMRKMIFKIIRLSPRAKKLITDKGVKDVRLFARSLGLRLPAADLTRLEQQQVGYARHSDFVDEVMESFISDDMLRGIAGIDSDYTRDMLDDVRNIFASSLKRKWLIDNNVMPEIWRLIDEDKDVNAVSEISDHYKAVFKNLAPIVKSVLKGISKTDTAIAKLLDKMGNGEDDEAPAPRPGIAAPFDDAGNDPFGGFVAEEPAPEENTPVDNVQPVPEEGTPNEEEPIQVPGTTQDGATGEETPKE